MRTLVEVIIEHYRFRRQIMVMAKTDLAKTYRRAALGWFWTIAKPSFMIFVYWFGIQIGLRASRNVGPYPFFLWLIAGTVPWFYMHEMLTQGTEAMRRYSYLITKVKFPVSIIPTFVSISHFMGNLPIVLIMIVLYWCYGYPPDIYILQLPFYMLYMVLFFCALTLLTSLLATISRDVSNLMKSITSAVFWFSGVIWDVEAIRNESLKSLLMFNPVTFVCTGFRNVFVHKIWFYDQSKRMGYAGFTLLIIITLALFAYRKLRKEIPDVL